MAAGSLVVHDARRTVARWVLAALIERGPAQAARPRESRPIERPLSAHEARRLLRPSPLLSPGT
jgi:hypothetical protein